MPKKPNNEDTDADLRRRAERRAKETTAKPAAPNSETDIRRMLHELEVHQIELEMQNAELRRARDDAETQRDLYTDLYDFAPVGYFTLAPDGIIRLANLTGSLLAGVDRAKLAGRAFSLLLSPDMRADFKAFLEKAFWEGSRQSIDTVITSGSAPPRIVNIKVLSSANGEECSAVVMDITERTQAEEQVLASEIRYRRLFEAAHDGVLLIDPETSRITDANPFMTKLLGYPRGQLIGKELFEIGLLKDEAASREMFRNLKTNHEVRYEDLPLESEDGRLHEVEVVANLYQEGDHSIIQCNIRDITARKLAEDKSRRSGILFTSLIEQAPVGVYVVSTDFRMQQANPTAMAVFQNVGPLIGRDFSEIVRAVWPRRAADQIIREFRRTLKTGEPYRSPAFAERRRDLGVKEVYEWQIQRVTLPDDEYGVVCFFENTTERAEAEAARRRLEVLSASNLKLKQQIVRRHAVEADLRSSRLEQSRLLKQSRRQEMKLRNLSHRLLHAQEDERKRISRELHDVIIQTLVGINVHMAALSSGAAANPRSLQKRVESTHELVSKAVETVHRFARELRPTMLDELGLIPTLQAFLKQFMEETGIRVRLKVFAGIEQSTDTVRTGLFRVAQEALTNVARHAKASQVEVSIRLVDGVIRMEIKDDGQGFDNTGTSTGKRKNRLGLLGMRERVEMMGGVFQVESAPGEPTTIRVEVPAEKGGKRKSRKKG
ncbi:PAS domain S-box protein [Akkermansiaceae bacterium]|nr:PAS domain S-box protein [Akkermansiaceae bacterium]